MTTDFLKAYLFSKRANSHIKKMAWISLSGIVLGTFALIVVLSIMSGLNRDTEDRLLKHEPHMVVQLNDSISAAEKKTYDFSTFLSENRIKDFQKENITKSYEFERQDLLIKTTEGFFNGAEALGIDKSALLKKKSFYGGLENPLAYDLEAFSEGSEVFIGADLAFELKIVVGDTIDIYKPEAILKSTTDFDFSDTKTVVVGGVLNSDGGDKESRLVVYSKGRLFKGMSRSMNKGLEIFFKEPSKVESYKKLLSAEGIKLETWRERNSSLFLALKIEKLAMTFLLGIALLITSFSIMTLLILIVVQKQKDIGILLSMGFSKKRIRLLFGGIGAGVSFCGIFIGGSLGVVVSLLLDLFPIKVLPPIYQNPYLPIDFNVTTVVWVLFFCSLVAVLSSLVPIIYLSKITPVTALKETSRI
jgi:lipoprotein-releasing system permease protein